MLIRDFNTKSQQSYCYQVKDLIFNQTEIEIHSKIWETYTQSVLMKL